MLRALMLRSLHTPIFADAVQYGEIGKRPSQYAFLDSLMRNGGNTYVSSLQKAEVYKRGVEMGKIKIQTVEDARGDPPKGFARTCELSRGSL